MSHRTYLGRRWYDFVRIVCRMVAVLYLRFRAQGQQYVPPEGGAMLLVNHQSHLDPVLMGVACDRHLNAMARDTLFRNKFFAGLIRSLNAYPIDREGSGLSGIKETLRRLKDGGLVLIFPEGTRTPDGQVQPLKPGFAALARRAKVPLVPAGIAGAYEAMPRATKFPRPGVVHVQFGPPISPDSASQMSEEDLVAEVHRRICQCVEEAERHRSLAMRRG